MEKAQRTSTGHGREIFNVPRLAVSTNGAIAKSPAAHRANTIWLSGYAFVASSFRQAAMTVNDTAEPSIHKAPRAFGDSAARRDPPSVCKGALTRKRGALEKGRGVCGNLSLILGLRGAGVNEGTCCSR